MIFTFGAQTRCYLAGLSGRVIYYFLVLSGSVMRSEYPEGVPLCWALTGPETREVVLPEIYVI